MIYYNRFLLKMKVENEKTIIFFIFYLQKKTESVRIIYVVSLDYHIRL